MRSLNRGVLPLLLLAAIACQSGADDDALVQDSEEPEMREWSVQVRSSGGITGRGDGSISIQSSGLAEKTNPNGTICRRTIEEALLGELSGAVSEARPGTWRDRYLQEGGADFFTYTLTMEIDGRRQPAVEWNDGVALPLDLARLADTLNTIRRGIDCPSPSPRR